VETVVRYGTQIADALAHAHERGVVHRDLKSANVIITPGGRAKVLDFGLAKRAIAAPEDTTHTQPLTDAGAVAGTLAYMAPEVLRGGLADPRSDLWALGVLLYQAVTGNLPFRGTTAFEITSAIMRDSPTALPQHVPPGLAAIIQHLLAKSPGERYQRAGEVRAALEAIQPVVAVSAPLVQVPTSRRRWLWTAAMVAVAALAWVRVSATAPIPPRMPRRMNTTSELCWLQGWGRDTTLYRCARCSSARSRSNSRFAAARASSPAPGPFDECSATLRANWLGAARWAQRSCNEISVLDVCRC
jgi:eukaryotic-like serine/threonine-protein kinase